MSDELDKFANELRGVGASKGAREKAMGLAMAAFDAEFESASEKTSEGIQENSNGMRPTEHTENEPVSISRNFMMSKINSIFSFTPRTTMMMGSCAAAMIAALVILPNADLTYVDPTETVDDISSVNVEPDVASSGSRVVEENEVADVQSQIAPADIVTKTPPTVQDADVQESELQDAEPESEPAPKSSPPASDPAVSQQRKSNGQISSVQQLLDNVSAKDAPTADKKKVANYGGTVQSAPPPVLAFEAPSVVLPPQSSANSGVSQDDLRSGKIPEGYQVMERVIPSVTRTETRRVMKTPARSVEREIPAVTKMETRQVQNEDGSIDTVQVPIVVQEARTEMVAIPAEYETVQETVVTQEASTELVLVPIAQNSRDQFEAYDPSPVVAVLDTPVSTFSVDVDTASYSFLRAAVNRGQLPPASAIRIEELINYFPYNYEAPTSANEPFKANVTVTSNPWNADKKLMHIGIKGYVPPATEAPNSNIVLLIDTSGSMNQPNKLPLLINSFKLLLGTLDENDTVSIVTYAGRAGVVLEPTAASEKAEIMSALERLRAGGSTAGAAGLELAYMKAQESFDDDSINRVILATDGDFNVGFSSPQEMKEFVAKKRDTGIFLSVLGFGQGNYNDHLMQALAQNGNGTAAYIDTLSEARKVLADESGSALFPIAKDVKIQIEFNPATIAEYRLLGYETRALSRQDFNNDKVDAGEINAGHTVTALYEITPVGSPARVIDDLRYASAPQTNIESDELAFVKIRHKRPNSDTSTLQTFPVVNGSEDDLRDTSNDVRFASAVAAAGQKLRGDTHVADYSFDEIIALAKSAKGEDEHGYRAEFIQLLELIKSLKE